MPVNGLAPVVLYYNKKVLADAGVEPPKTYDDLLAAVKKLKAKDVVPLSLAANSKWPTLMYLEYLLDRTGGSRVFSKIAAGDASAWTGPVGHQGQPEAPGPGEGRRLRRQRLVRQLRPGRLHRPALHGQGGDGGDGHLGVRQHRQGRAGLRSRSDLGYTAFPTLSDGTGSPDNIVGNPSNFLSLNSSTKHKSAALKLPERLRPRRLAGRRLPRGRQRAAGQGAGREAGGDEGGRPTRSGCTFVYDLVRQAPSFQLSWDQALPSDQADPLLTNTDKSFLRQISPDRVRLNMSKAAS